MHDHHQSSLLVDLLYFGWDLFTKVGVPLLAALLAGGIIGFQIRADQKSVQRQLDAVEVARVEERRILGIQTASNLFFRDAEIPFEMGSNPTLEWLKSNRDLITVYANLSGADRPVARWVATQHARHIEMTEAWIASITPETDLSIAGGRGGIARASAEATEILLEWLRNDPKYPTQWFAERIPSE